jgi:D-alanyl-D-alanine carboxypeptidase (penicillin-binding protein 5/6)
MRPDNPDEPGAGDGVLDVPEDEPEPEEPDEPENLGAFSALFGPPEANAAGAINSPFGALYNLSDDIFIYGKRVDDRVYPSGTVKLLTALVVYDALDPEFIFIVDNEIEMISRGSGVAGLVEGQRVNMEGILTALLIPVGNDAAYTISVNTARALSGSPGATNFEMNDYFLRLMNDYAKNLGAENSNFSNPDGFHAENNYSTVRDLTIIAAATAMNPMVSAITGKIEHEVQFESGGSLSWTNSNAFLSLENWDIRGLRTGYTDESAFSAQILAYINGKEYIAAVSGAPTAAAREQDIIRLLQMARDGYDASIITVFEN